MPNAKPLSVAELAAILPRLEATVAILAGGAAPSPARAAAPSPRAAAAPSRGKGEGKAKGKGRRARGSSAEGAAIQQKLLAVVAGGKGLSMSDVVERSSLKRGPVEYHLHALRAQKKVRVVGNRGQARWFAA